MISEKLIKLNENIDNLLEWKKLAEENMNTNNFNASEGYIPDSSNLPIISGKIRGGINQETREGYNRLYVTTNSTGSKNGLTYEINNNEITLNGIPTANTDIYMINWWLASEENPKRFLKKGNYTLAFVGANNNRMLVNLYQGNKQLVAIPRSRNIANMVLTEDSYYSVFYLSIDSGVTFNNETFKFMLLEGTYTSENLPNYEPYGAMPSPDYHSAVNVVDGNYDIAVSNNQLLDILKFKKAGFTTTINGVKFLINDNGSITLNGTASANADFYIAGNWGSTTTQLILKSGEYSLNSDNSNVNMFFINNTTVILNGIGVASKTIKQNQNITAILIRANAGATFNNTIIKTMLVAGKYTDSDFPVFEEHQEKILKLDTTNRNKLIKPLSEYVWTANGSSTLSKENAKLKFNSNGVSLFSGVFFNINLSNLTDEEKKFLTSEGNLLSFNLKANQDCQMRIGTTTNLISFNANETKRVYITTNNINYVCYVAEAKVVEVELSDIMLTKGTQELAYVPHTDDYSYPLYNESDYYYKENGKWYVHNEWRKLIITGNELWQYYNDTSKPVFYFVTNNDSEDIWLYDKRTDWKCYCNYYKGKENAVRYDDVYEKGNGICSFRTIYPRFVIRDDSYTNLTSFKKKLKELYDNNTPLYVIYKKSTSTETEITNSVLINQLNQLLNLKTYKNGTNISQVGNTEVLSKLDIEYIVDKDYIQSAILKIEPEL